MPKQNDVVTVVDNETGEETTGRIVTYTKDLIVIQKSFDAKKVHFKEENKQ